MEPCPHILTRMTIARSRLLDPTRATWVHCTSRCVRRAFLCGDGCDHRKDWIEERLRFLARCFAAEVAGYAVMSNHLHVVLRMQPSLVATWSAEEVARRWLSVYPREYLPDGTPVLPSDAVIASRASDWIWVQARRKRLADLGWFMKALKEPISRRANREDGCTGAFWEGRFSSVPLLDQPALIACLVYVDLNPVRARICDRPERSRHTSGRERIVARQRHRLAVRLAQEGAGAHPGAEAASAGPEEGLWLMRLRDCVVGEVLGNRRFDADTYLTLLDATGRIVRAGKRGAIPSTLAPILARLDVTVEAWVTAMTGRRSMSGGGVGGREARAAEAERRGARCVQNRSALFSAGRAA